MKDLTNPFWIKLKGLLFLLLGCVSALLVWLAHPKVETAIYLGVAIWSFCRFYYFAFYVLERYIDPSYRFSGLSSMLRHLMARK